MSNEPKRRWFQLRVGTMLWMTTVVALAPFGLRERQLRLRYQAIAETNPSKAYQVQLEHLNALLERELTRAHALYPDFEETPLPLVRNPDPNRNWIDCRAQSSRRAFTCQLQPGDVARAAIEGGGELFGVLAAGLGHVGPAAAAAADQLGRRTRPKSPASMPRSTGRGSRPPPSVTLPSPAEPNSTATAPAVLRNWSISCRIVVGIAARALRPPRSSRRRPRPRRPTACRR